MEELLVVAGVMALVVWWAHSGASPPQSQPTQAAVVQPATPAPATPRQRPRPKPPPGNSEVGRDLSEEACPASLGSARTEFTRPRHQRRRRMSFVPC